MHRRTTRTRGRLALVAGFLVGALAGLAALSGAVLDAGADDLHGHGHAQSAVERGLRDVLHTPPLLIARDARVVLRYDVVCQADTTGRPCRPAGSLFVRRSGSTSFVRVPLVAGVEARLTAELPPAALAGPSLAYYAVVDDGAGSELTVPAAGAAAPQRAWILDRVQHIALGRHAFGAVRSPGETRVRASWGDGDGAVGLFPGRTQSPIGPSAFDVSASEAVIVLDQANGRLATYPAGGSRPSYAALPFAGGEGDLAVLDDGTAYVLDHGGGPRPIVRKYSPRGAGLGQVTTALAGADMLRAGPRGVLAHGFPGDMWTPVDDGGALLQPSAQAARVQGGRAVAEGLEVVVSAADAGATFALVRGDRAVQAWRVTSETPLGEIQLAEPLGDGLLVVARIWTDERAEFEVITLPAARAPTAFSVEAVEWAEAAALGRFRLEGSTLYQMRSAPDGVRIVTFDVGGV